MTIMMYGIKLFTSVCVFLAIASVVPPDSNERGNGQVVTYWDAAKAATRSLRTEDSKGTLNGIFRQWDENGRLIEEGLYSHNEIVSDRAWYTSGKVRRDEHAREGLLDGWQTWWAPNGEILKRVYFSMGTGVEYYFNDDGSERRHICWLGGVELKVEDLLATTTPATRDSVLKAKLGN